MNLVKENRILDFIEKKSNKVKILKIINNQLKYA